MDQRSRSMAKKLMKATAAPNTTRIRRTFQGFGFACFFITLLEDKEPKGVKPEFAGAKRQELEPSLLARAFNRPTRWKCAGASRCVSVGRAWARACLRGAGRAGETAARRAVCAGELHFQGVHVVAVFVFERQDLAVQLDIEDGAGFADLLVDVGHFPVDGEIHFAGAKGASE